MKDVVHFFQSFTHILPINPYLLIDQYYIYVYKVASKAIEPNEEPPRYLMWCKGHENKAGEIVNDEIKTIAEKLVSLIQLMLKLCYQSCYFT